MGKAKEQKETAAQKALAEHAMLQLQDYKKRWLPVQQRLAQTIEAAGKEGSAERRAAAGRSSTDTAMAFSKAQGAVEKSLTNSGVGPGSSRANLAVAGLGDDAAKSTGLGHMMSEQAIDDAYTQGLGALTAIGRGERAMVGSSMSSMAASSAAQAGADAQAAAMNREGNAALIGQVAGFGLQQGLSSTGGTGNVQGIGGGYNSFDPFGPFRDPVPMTSGGVSLPTRGGA